MPAKVAVDNSTKRSDADALQGHFVRVIDGEHQGRFGVFDHVVEHDGRNGYPKRIVVVPREAPHQLLVVDYKDVRHVEQARRHV